MTPLQIYKKKLAEKIERRRLEKMIDDLNDAQSKVAPLQKKYWDELWNNRRMDGPNGFQMVRPKY